MINLQFDREKQLKKWKNSKAKIKKSAALRHLLEIYSRASDVVLNPEAIDFEKIGDYARELIAQDFREFLLDGGQIWEYKEKVERDTGECRRKFEEYQRHLNALTGVSEGSVLGVEKGRLVLKRINLEATREKLRSEIDITRKQLKMYDAFPGVFDDVTAAGEKEIQLQKKGEFRRFARENLKKLEAEVEPRKMNLSPEMEKLARFAFLFQQWEHADSIVKKEWHPDRAAYWDTNHTHKYPNKDGTVHCRSHVNYGRKNFVRLFPTEFMQDQEHELEPLLYEALGIENSREKLEELASRGYLTRKDARKAASYLELAAKCPEDERAHMMPRRTLQTVAAPAEQSAQKKRPLTGEEVRVIIPALGEDLAEILAKKINEETLVKRQKELSDLLDSDEASQQILANNPALLLEDKGRFDEYLHLMKQYVAGEESPEKARGKIASDASRFGDVKKLRRIVGSRYEKAPEIALPQDRRNMYDAAFANAGYDRAFVEAMITQGMKIHKKYFGESYISTPLLFKNMRTFFKTHPELAEDFEKTRNWLVDQGVIIHHSGKGRARDQGTVSLNSHLSEIKSPVLRDYVAEIFTAYGISHRSDAQAGS